MSLLYQLKFLLLISTMSIVGECLGYDQPPHTEARTHRNRHRVPKPSYRSMDLSTGTGIDPPLPSPVGRSSSDFKVGFYEGKCFDKGVDVEGIISSEVEARFDIDPSLLPGLLRLQFHDCFVHGCDASILIDGNTTEKSASPNRSVRGYEFIEAIKLAVETKCPGVVSCADIIAIATKVLIKLGGGPDYPIQTGRRDGLVSRADDADDLPSPFLSVDEVIEAFAAKNFSTAEMVVLLGCHTVGIAHCRFISDRLYPGTTQFDPLMDPDLRAKLISTCPQDTLSNNFTFLDQGPRSSNRVDNSFFTQIVKQKGVLPIDQELARDPQTQAIVQQLSLNATLFNIELANAMLKLQALDILTGEQGEVRKVCGRVN
ncbi:hypothetical protein RND81_04G148300 [Saponaria officinalis]|uniref:Peroxidase n=1 Tax=Saponaria officinalis TaxID=3572 RepID=A0AAW1LN28_SAPOF